MAFWCFVCPSGLGPLLTTSVAVRLLAFAGVESGLCAERYNNTPTRTACDYVLRTPRTVFFFLCIFSVHVPDYFVILTRVTESYLLALGTTQIKLFFHQALNEVSNSSDRELSRDMFRFKTI